MNSIQLSILIPTCNFKSGVNKILECLESIEENLKDSIQIIISDDSDNEIIEKNRNKFLKKQFKNYIYRHNIRNLGAIDNWNKLISLAQGEYIWLLHHDEFWDERKNIIRYVFEVITTQKPNVLILPITKSKNIKINNYNINISNRHITFNRILRYFINNPKFLFRTNIIGPPSSLIYKKIKINYDKNLKYLVDVEFYIRLFKFYDSKNILIGFEFYNLISSQNNKNSITKMITKEIRSLKIKEKIFISRKYKFKFSIYENIISFFSFLIFKIYSLITTKINIKKL